MAIKRIALCILCLLLSTPPMAENEMLTACGHNDYPPFNWYDGEQYQGVAVDIINRIAEELNIQIELKYVGPWARCLQLVTTGNIDILLAAYATDSRKEFAIFTDSPLSQDRKAVFVWEGQEFTFDSWQDLAGKKAAIQRGVSFGQEFDQFLLDNVTVFQVTDRLQYFQMLKAKRIDFIPTGEFLGLIHAKRAGYEGKVVALKKSLSVGYLYLGLSKKSQYTALMPEINRVFSNTVRPELISELSLRHMKNYLATIEPAQP